MAVVAVGEHYKCNICGNEVTVNKAGGGTLVCCNQGMVLTTVTEQKSVDDEIPV